MQYADFDKINEVGSGGYGTVYTASCSMQDIPRLVVLKRFNNFEQMPELFISEVSDLDTIN